jgi:hypothetical protein
MIIFVSSRLAKDGGLSPALIASVLSCERPLDLLFELRRDLGSLAELLDLALDLAC